MICALRWGITQIEPSRRIGIGRGLCPRKNAYLESQTSQKGLLPRHAALYAQFPNESVRVLRVGVLWIVSIEVERDGTWDWRISVSLNLVALEEQCIKAVHPPLYFFLLTSDSFHQCHCSEIYLPTSGLK
jgi:hypothetical protein